MLLAELQAEVLAALVLVSGGILTWLIQRAVTRKPKSDERGMVLLLEALGKAREELAGLRADLDRLPACPWHGERLPPQYDRAVDAAVGRLEQALSEMELRLSRGRK